MNDKYKINDTRLNEEFKQKTFSGFQKKDVIAALFKAIDQVKEYSESAIIDRNSGELVHEITRNIKSENSEKEIFFYLCIKQEKKV